MTSPLRILSLGAGVQSTTLLQLCIEGEIPCDAAIFADTGWEPRAVYDHLETLKPLAANAGIPVHVVSEGNIRDTQGRAFFNIPYFLVGENGEHGMSRRQCTQRSKIAPIRRKVREIMEATGHTIKERPAVIQYIGISWDEIQRMKPSDVRFIEHRWPLIDRKWSRNDCKTFLRDRGIDAPRSACIGCPFHSDHEWRNLRDNAPDEFADAVRFEREVQASNIGLRGTPYLHAARVPLDEVDFSTKEDHGQLSMDAECEGMCGV